jgi:uncharacterized protein (DUF1697 family)
MPPVVQVPHIGLLRGVNVGRGNRIAMADLRAMVEALGYTGVRTFLNSGNVVFATAPGGGPKAAAAIAAGLARYGIATPVFVLTATALQDILAAHPFPAIVTDPSRLLIAVFADGAVPPRVAALVERDWGGDRFATVSGAGYLWCASGILDSPLQKAFSRAAGDAATARNWNTMTQLATLAGGADPR